MLAISFKIKRIYLLIFLGLLSCDRWGAIVDVNDRSFNGILQGKITIGPLCPVETNPPDSACLPTADTYKAWATAVFSGDKKTKIKTINPDLSGNFSGPSCFR